MLLPKNKTPARADINDFVVLLYGPPKIGKTTFANAEENTLFLATEAGLTGMDAYRVDVDSWAMFKTTVDALANEKHPYVKVVIDTIDNLYKLCAEHVCAELNVVHESDASWGKGTGLIKREFSSALSRLALLPPGLWMISHSMEKEIKPKAGAAYTVITPTLPNAPREIVTGMADLILYADKRFDEERTEERVLYTRGDGVFEAGGRINWLPSVMPLNYSAFKQAFVEGLKPVQCELCKKEIARSETGMSAVDVAHWGREKVGKALCVDCLKAAMDKAQKEQNKKNIA